MSAHGPEETNPRAGFPSSDDHYRILIEGITDHAIFMLDSEGIVISWNTGAERIKGYRADEIIGQHFSKFYSTEDIAHRRCDRAPWNPQARNRVFAEAFLSRNVGGKSF